MPTFRQLVKQVVKRLPKKRFVVAKALKRRPQLRGICQRIFPDIAPKKPNSAKRRVAKIRLSTGQMIRAYVNGMGREHRLQRYSAVMVRGGRRRDIPGIHYQLIRGKYDFIAKENSSRMRRRSKFGVKRPQIIALV
jgi:small subunit ribosomal protein S12